MLELALLFGLLPLAAATGWYVARRSDSSRKRASSLSSNYFRGLNYLLNEQPDKAIEVFLKIAEVNQDTVETHLALGNLFRRRGEMDKAIRFHKHIISRPNLTDEQRSQALLELGEDYMRAGLLDRAERLFVELLDHDPKSQVPARQLLDIYQQEKDWEKAIAKARHLHGDVTSETLIAQFYCELAQQALARDEPETVRQMLRQARRYDPQNARARLLEGELAWQHQAWAEAARHYREACELDCDATVAVIDRIMECHRHIGRIDELRDWLTHLCDQSAMTTPALALARLMAKDDMQKAVDFLLARLSERPTVRGLEFLMELLNQQGVSLDQVGPELVRDLMQRLLDGQPRYRCQQCGFSGTSYHWLCPSCRRWNTTRAIRGVLGE
ncbi:MAG: lipopolysaccharide assembly protein LapB [Wenzhouxiangella sp.]